MPPLYAWYGVELGRRKLLPISFDPVLLAEFDRRGSAALDILIPIFLVIASSSVTGQRSRTSAVMVGRLCSAQRKESRGVAERRWVAGELRHCPASPSRSTF